MKIWIGKILEEDIDINTCKVKLFDNEASACEWADKEIDDYAVSEDGIVTERSPHYYRMQSGDCYVTIEIEMQEL